MTQRTTFIRKIVYLSVIALLLLPLSILSRPAARDAEGNLLPGGTLAKLRDEHKIGQANLGEIDPTSVAARLSTLGMSGIAANVYWRRAHEYRKTENWTEFENTLNEISKLQPNFISVWKYQAWNLSYNISVEFDDFRTRYLWVKKGIEFLIKGTRYNDQDYRLAWDVGWFLNQKIGKADEQDQYRRLFKRDMREDDRGGDPDLRKLMPFSLDDCEDPRGDRDNWLVGQQWYDRSNRIVEENNVRPGLSPPVYYSSGPMSAIKYAAQLVKDGVFERDAEPIRRAWKDAHDQWIAFGNRTLKPPGSLPHVRLNDLELYEKRAVDLDKRIAKLKEEGDAADQALLRALLFERLDVEKKLRFAKKYRDTSNYEYWLRRCEYEQRPEATSAHRLAFEARQAFERGEMIKSLELYSQCFANWRLVLNDFPDVVDKMGTLGDVGDHIEDYKKLLSQLEYPLPSPFILQDVLDAGQGQD